MDKGISQLPSEKLLLVVDGSWQKRTTTGQPAENKRLQSTQP